MKHAIPMMLGAALLAASPACAEDNSFAGPYLGVEAGYEAYPDDFNGAMVGGIAGSTVGKGRGSDVAAVLGAIAGEAEWLARGDNARFMSDVALRQQD